MEAEFYSVVSHARAYSLTNGDVGTDGLYASLARWEKEVRHTTASYREAFVNQFYSELVRVAFTLRNIQHSKIRSLYDKIFTRDLKWGKHVATPLTYLFQQFIRGITHFDHQSVAEIPIYHRLESCGSGDDAFRKTYQRCRDDMRKEERDDVKCRIETCYIERLIYDQMYRHLAMADIEKGHGGHDHRLRITREDFRTCFPNLDIDINVEFDMHWPVAATITRKIRGVVTSVETYRKNIVFDENFSLKKYDDAVEAWRETGKYKYFRVQRFTSSPAWIRIGNVK